MNTLTPKEVVVQWFERVWNAKDKSAIPLLMSEDAIAHLAGDLQANGREEFSRFQDTLLSAFPDLTVQILRVVGDETQACLRWQARASHKGEFAGIAQTDRPVHFTE
ncbi:MAG TPA: ester cyclase [Terrimicrobiaceae bacterium]